MLLLEYSGAPAHVLNSPVSGAMGRSGGAGGGSRSQVRGNDRRGHGAAAAGNGSVEHDAHAHGDGKISARMTGGTGGGNTIGGVGNGGNSSSGGTIYRCCDAILTFLEEQYMHTEQLRSFMETSLPLILKNIFGFEDGLSNGGGWLHAVSRAGMEKEWQYVYKRTLSCFIYLWW